MRSAFHLGAKVAVKEVIRKKINEESLLEIQAESAILSSLVHPNILSFIGTSIHSPKLYFVSEYMDRGSFENVSVIVFQCGNNYC